MGLKLGFSLEQQKLKVYEKTIVSRPNRGSKRKSKSHNKAFHTFLLITKYYQNDQIEVSGRSRPAAYIVEMIYTYTNLV
jgi:hypothetical protein